MTVVLIHGGGTTARFWDRMTPYLDTEPLAVDLPGRGAHPADLATLTVAVEVASVVADIEERRARRAGHARGALLGGPGRARRRRRTWGPGRRHRPQRRPRAGRGRLRHRLHAGAAPRRLAPGRWPPRRRTAARSPCRPLPPIPRPCATPTAATRWTTRPWPSCSIPCARVEDTVQHYFQPVHWSAAAGVPITYVLNERDRPVRRDDQEVMVRRLPAPAEVIRVDSGHLLPVTSPAAFAEIVTRVAA